MADDKNSRDKQAHDAERRQQQRRIATAVERGDEPEPPVDPTELADIKAELDALSFPTTGAEVVAAIGNREIDTAEGRYRIADLVPETEEETYHAPAAVIVQVETPTVAAAMKRVVEASKTLRNPEFSAAQRNAYERTFQELKAIDAIDDDAGIPAIRDWIVEQIHDKETMPTSRSVRRQAAKYCRANGYQVRNDEWLGI